MKIRRSSACYVFFRKKPGFRKKVFAGLKKRPFKMKYIGKKVTNQASKSFFWFNIFLATVRAVPAFDCRSAVQTFIIIAQLGV
jgi:hypothetical protein